MSTVGQIRRLPLGRSFGQICREVRLALDVTQQQVANRVGVSRGYVGKVERGTANPSIDLVEAIASALGIELDLVARSPVVHDERRHSDSVHARCSAHVDRRLRALGLAVAREVEVVHGRSHGWIDILAFDRRTGTLLLVEIKTRLDDLGAIERQFSWYERSAWALARDLGWAPRQMRSWLVALASEEIEQVLRTNRDLFDHAFPGRAGDMLSDIAGGPVAERHGRALAMLDPSNRGRRWLIRTRLDA